MREAITSTYKERCSKRGKEKKDREIEKEIEGEKKSTTQNLFQLHQMKVGMKNI